MAELLSREKELFHINQELNLMALNHPIDNGSQFVGQSRYCTYLKQKGPSTLLKKNFCGTANADGAISHRQTAGRGHRSKGTKSPNKSAPATPTPPSMLVTTPRSKQTAAITPQLTKTKTSEWRSARSNGKYGTAVVTTNAAAALATTTAAATTNNSASAALAAGRIEGTFTRRATHKTATFVKYRNPNFKPSPSLDLLLHNGGGIELQEAQQQEQPQQLQPQLQQQQQVELELVQQSRESTTVISGQSKKQLTQDNFIK